MNVNISVCGDIGCICLNVFYIYYSYFLLLKYAFYYHNASQRLKMCQTWQLETCQNLPGEPCFETLIKGSQSQVMAISQSHETLNKTWVTAISSKSFSMNAYYASCCIRLMNTRHNSVAFSFVQILTHRQTAPLKRANKDHRIQKEILP